MSKLRTLATVAALAASAAAIGPGGPASAEPAQRAAAAQQPVKKVALPPQARPIQTMDVAQSFRNQATGEYLTIDFASSPGYVIGTRPGAVSWYVHVFQDGTRRFQNLYQLKCMTAVSNSVWPTNSPSECDASEEQSFFIKRWNDGTIEIKSQLYGKCLEDTGNLIVQLNTCNASTAQSWY